MIFLLSEKLSAKTKDGVMGTLLQLQTIIQVHRESGSQLKCSLILLPVLIGSNIYSVNIYLSTDVHGFASVNTKTDSDLFHT